jgi:hypothetical protein
VKYVVTKKRLQAGLGSAGVRQLQFVIAEEGITAAAYMVVSIVDRTWTIEDAATVTSPAHGRRRPSSTHRARTGRTAARHPRVAAAWLCASSGHECIGDAFDRYHVGAVPHSRGKTTAALPRGGVVLVERRLLTRINLRAVYRWHPRRRLSASDGNGGRVPTITLRSCAVRVFTAMAIDGERHIARLTNGAPARPTGREPCGAGWPASSRGRRDSSPAPEGW